MGKILVGVSSWTDPTLIQSGGFYPSWAKSAEDRLKYYASQFDLLFNAKRDDWLSVGATDWRRIHLRRQRFSAVHTTSHTG